MIYTRDMHGGNISILIHMQQLSLPKVGYIS